MARILLLSVIVGLILFLFLWAWDVGHNLNEPRKHSIVRRSANINYTKILSFWKDHKNELVLHGEHKEVVFVMGNTGAGKTTLVSAVTGRKLRSIMSKGNRVIVDEEDRIGTGVSSKTLIPEIMTDRKRNVTYIDCSGFRDNRNIEYEITSIYFQNILMDQFERIKFLFVIHYDSLRVSGNKNDFDDLLEHIGEFIRDMSKFHDGIALVATKVENVYDESSDGTVFLVNDDKTVLRGIADYLQLKKEIYRSKTDDSEKYKKFVDFIDVLLEKKNDSFTRIAIFRQPTRQGLLEDLPKTKNEINTIAKMTTENLQYVEKKTGDFGFALSKSSKNTVDQIVNDIFRNTLVNRLHKIGNETLTYYLQLEKRYNDIGILRKRVTRAFDVISRVKDVDEPQELFQELLDAVNTLHITVSLTNLNIISDDIKASQFFTTVSNSYKDTHMILLKNKMQNIIDSIENLKNFYDFLDNLQGDLAAYESQKLKSSNRIANIMTSCKSSKYETVQNIMDLGNIAEEIGSDHIYQKIKTLKVNQFQLKHLEAVFSAFSSKLEYSCLSSSKEMIVKGYNVKMSDVVKIDCWTHAKNIQVFALNKVFIDCTMDKTGEEVQLFIFSPTWEIEGEQKIILNGKDGEPHEKLFAKSASSNTENKPNGLPGLPGGPAGNFFGVGRQFINSEQLEIYTDSGNGGPGQHGGNGADAIAGDELPESFFKTFFEMDPEATSIVEYLDSTDLDNDYELYGYIYLHSIIYEFSGEVNGKSAVDGSDGGDGGVGGIGGYPGQIVINGLGKPVNVKVSNHSGTRLFSFQLFRHKRIRAVFAQLCLNIPIETGLTGLAGQAGKGGKGAPNGRSVEFTYHYYTGLSSVFKSPYYSDIIWIGNGESESGVDGEPDRNNKYQRYPVKLPLVRPSLVINSFKDFVRTNLFENIKEFELRTFVHELENDNQIKAQYDTFAFVKELEGLEDQFLEMRNKIDFGSFYDSFLARVEEFAMSNVNVENKKVLSYIYTAALTKVFTLKEKREDKTVVDLSKYLNTIEISIKEIREAQHLQIVRNYRDDYKNTLHNKIQKANDFIENKIEPEINRLWGESGDQVMAIINEIKQNKNSTNHAIELLEKDRAKIQNTILFNFVLLPLKLAASALSFFGAVGAKAGAEVTSAVSVAKGMFVSTIPSREQNKIYSVDLNSKSMLRVLEVYNIKPQQLADKLTVVIATLEEYKEELPEEEEKNVFFYKIEEWKLRLNGVENKSAHTIADVDHREKELKNIENQMNEFVNLREDILEEEKKQLEITKVEEENLEILKKKEKIEKSLRVIKHVQSTLESVTMLINFAKELVADTEVTKRINNQISEYVDQLRDLYKLEADVYNTVIPDLRNIEETIDAIQSSANGSSHTELDITKWNVRSTLGDVKSLLQKFTHKMTFELQSNLKRYMEKIDEGFSILIDIYDRIDSYSDSVRQAEYMAHIVSKPIMDVQVSDPELSAAMIALKFMIQSNILFEKYGIALHAFKQHYFPFAARTLQKFELPTGMQLNDIETLRSNIIQKIKDMKNHIDESEATIDKYSKFIHKKNIFDSNTTGSAPFYVWKHNTIKNEVQQLLNGSEIIIKADISKGVYYNAVKYTDVGINLNFNNKNLHDNFTSALKNFALTMTMVGNHYYRCGERYYFISFDDDITISYTLEQDEEKNWINPNLVYTTIHDSHPFLSPFGMWSIKLTSVDNSSSFEQLNVYANETIDLELIGRGFYIEQHPDFNFDICNEYLDTFYNVENIAKELV